MSASIDIRPATEHDIPVLRDLFEAGMDEGKVRINDTGADIENLTEGYLTKGDRSGFWVARLDTDVVGMIGVQRVDDSVAEMRRLRVHAAYRRRGVGSALMRHAVRFCRDEEYLKIVLDVRGERAEAITLFEKFGFYLARTRTEGERRILDFYVDLYNEPETDR